MASTDNPEWAALRLSLLPLVGTVPCCGLNCTGPPTVDAQHICVACKALCCGICRKRNADGTELNEIKTFVVCTQHDEAAGGREGGDLEDAEVGNLTNSAVGGLLGLRSAAAQSAASGTDAGSSSRPHVVTPPLDNDPATVWPEHSEEQRGQAVALIAGAEGNNYDVNIRFLSRNVNLKKKESMQKYNSLRPTNKRDCHKPPLHWVGVQSWEVAIINICIWQRVLTAAQREEEKKKAKKILPAIQHQLRKNVKALDKKRPPLQALESEQPSQPAAEGSRSSGRLRNAEIESLVAQSAASAQDPGRQERARAAAGPVALEHSGLAILINCAGVMFFTEMKNGLVDQWEQTVDVNCKGVMHGIGAVLPKMVARGKGKILTISSDAGMRQFPSLAVYCASKTFVETLCEITRRELVGTGVTLTTILPGDVKGTELIMKNTDEESAAKIGVEIGKAVGTGFARNQLLDTDDVAHAVIYALTAPPHVAINTVLIEPRDQE